MLHVVLVLLHSNSLCCTWHSSCNILTLYVSRGTCLATSYHFMLHMISVLPHPLPNLPPPKNSLHCFRFSVSTLKRALILFIIYFIHLIPLVHSYGHLSIIRFLLVFFLLFHIIHI